MASENHHLTYSVFHVFAVICRHLVLLLWSRKTNHRLRAQRSLERSTWRIAWKFSSDLWAFFLGFPVYLLASQWLPSLFVGFPVRLASQPVCWLPSPFWNSLVPAYWFECWVSLLLCSSFLLLLVSSLTCFLGSIIVFFPARPFSTVQRLYFWYPWKTVVFVGSEGWETNVMKLDSIIFLGSWWE